MHRCKLALTINSMCKSRGHETERLHVRLPVIQFQYTFTILTISTSEL